MEAEGRLWQLLADAARDPAAWPALLVELEPELLAFARRQPIGRLRTHDDSPREILTRVIARLHANDRAAIHQLCALDPRPKLEAWLRVVVRRSAIDYMRENPEYERATAVRPDRWISLATLSSGAGTLAPDTLAEKRRLVVQTTRDMVERTRAEVRERGNDAYDHLALEWRIARIHVRRLATRGDQLLAVLVAVLEGRTQAAIAESLAITRREVELSVRYLEEMLQARFADEGGT